MRETSILGFILGLIIVGLIADALFRGDADDIGLAPSGIIGSIVGAIIALLVYNAATRRSAVNR